MNGYIFFGIALALALTYAFWNGANDRANSIATIVKTKALTYKQAVILAGILNFVGPLTTSAVAKTLAKGIVPPEFITQSIVLGGLIGGIWWAAFATWRGIPVSITHSLVGGVAGAGIAQGGFGILVWDTLFFKILLGIALAPILGFIAGFIILITLKWITFPIQMSRYTANRNWRWGQVISSSWLSLSHGMNDGQNAIGIIALAFFTAGFASTLDIEWWMILLGGAAIGLGTAIAGWRVTHTVGWKITDLEPIDGFAAEASSAGVLTLASFLGMPVSTTHVAVSGIMAVGSAKNLKSINWTVTNKIFMAWVLTIPAAALVGALSTHLISLLI